MSQVLSRVFASSFAPQRRAVCGLVCALSMGRAALAEAPRLGAGDSTLPGYFRVPVVAASSRGALVGAGVGYAFTENQEAAPGSHHRVGGRIGAGLTPLPWLGLSLGTSLRHDRHSDVGPCLIEHEQLEGPVRSAGLQSCSLAGLKPCATYGSNHPPPEQAVEGLRLRP